MRFRLWVVVRWACSVVTQGGRRYHTSLSLSVDGGKCHKGAAQDEHVGKGDQESLPVNVEHVLVTISVRFYGGVAALLKEGQW